MDYTPLDRSNPAVFALSELTPEEEARIAQLKSKAERLKLIREGKTKILACQERSWLRKHGKKQYIDFDGATRKQLRKYFMAMDEDGSGFISIDELLDPLVALGLAETREEVKQLFDVVDTDKSNKIEFDDSSTMATFFKDMASGKLIPHANELPFNLVVSNYRRKMFMDGIVHNDPRGEKVVRAYLRIREDRSDVSQA